MTCCKPKPDIFPYHQSDDLGIDFGVTKRGDIFVVGNDVTAMSASSQLDLSISANHTKRSMRTGLILSPNAGN
jgi:hypothetical protein